MFLDILVGYYNDATNDQQVAARAERIIVEKILSGMPPAVAVAQREAMRAFLRNRRKLFDSTHLTFFFVDKHPEIADRFRMTYELCFEEGPIGAKR